MEPLLDLTTTDLRQLAGALRSGRLSSPFTELATASYVEREAGHAVADALTQLVAQGMNPQQLVLLLEALATDRSRRETPESAIELVSTGPEAPGVTNRDTRIVVDELFRSARHSVVVVGYAVYQGLQVFKSLAERMDADGDLHVQMFLNIDRGQGDTSTADDIVRRFAQRYRTEQWPGHRIPEIYYDPRSLETDSRKRTSLHAKCVVVDGERSLVSSANFTEAAQLRNIEVGVLIRSPWFAKRLTEHFTMLADRGLLLRVPVA